MPKLAPCSETRYFTKRGTFQVLFFSSPVEIYFIPIITNF